MFLVAGCWEPPLAVKTPRRASATMITKGRFGWGLSVFSVAVGYGWVPAQPNPSLGGA